MEIKVYCDEDLVFTGPLEQFLTDNDNDEWLTEKCSKLPNTVEFSEFSGDWRIEAAA